MHKKIISFILCVALVMLPSSAVSAYELASDSNATEITVVNDDSSVTIHYEETIHNVDPDDLNDVVTSKTEEQEQKKEEIENQDGQYDYTITTTEEIIYTPITVPANNYEKAEEIASEHDGKILTEETIVETTVSETFDNLEAAQAYIDEIGKEHTIVEAVINVTPEQIISGVTAQQIEENGYHVVETENGYDIIITGGLEEISIDLAGLSAVLEPGDSISATFNIINESGDKYEIKEYSKVTEGPYRYIRTTSFNEEMGLAVGTLMDGAYTYYIPNDFVKLHGRSNLATPADEVVKWYNKKNDTTLSYSQIRNVINDDLLLEYYNEILGKEYESLYDAWVENFNSRLWKTTYNGVDGQVFFSTIDFDKDAITYNFKATIDGPATDNMYQSTVWGYIENLVLKVVDTIIPASYEAVVTYEDKEYTYSVEYNEEDSSYTIEIVGDGFIPSVEIVIPPEEEEIQPIEEPDIPSKEDEDVEPEIIPTKPEIIPTEQEEDPIVKPTKEETEEISDEPIPQTNSPQPIVLGVSRPRVDTEEQGIVLGASRQPPKTGHYPIEYICILVMIISLIVLLIACRKKVDK